MGEILGVLLPKKVLPGVGRKLGEAGKGNGSWYFGSTFTTDGISTLNFVVRNEAGMRLHKKLSQAALTAKMKKREEKVGAADDQQQRQPVVHYAG